MQCGRSRCRLIGRVLPDFLPLDEETRLGKLGRVRVARPLGVEPALRRSLTCALSGTDERVVTKA
jgi:hypothetical protein